jgi:hypothetical protein
LGDLEQRVNGLVAALEASPPLEKSVRERNEEAEQVAASDLDPELGKAADLAWWNRVLASFENEEIDRSWATRTAASLSDDLDLLSEAQGYTPIATECRSTKCRAVVEWPGYSEATAGFGALLHHDFRTDCARQTLLPEPSGDELEEPYEMTMVFDCRETVD